MNLILICLVVFVVISLIFNFIKTKIRILFGYKKYKYTKILSYGMKENYKWCRNDDIALTHYNHYEFVEEIQPNRRRIKPIKNK